MADLLWNPFGWDETLPEGGGLSEAQKWQTGLFAASKALDQFGWGQPIGNIGNNLLAQRSTYTDMNEKQQQVAAQKKWLEQYAENAEKSGASPEATNMLRQQAESINPGVPLPQQLKEVPGPLQDMAGQNRPWQIENMPKSPEAIVRPLRAGEEFQDPDGPAGQMMSEKTVTVGDEEQGYWVIPSVFREPLSGRVHYLRDVGDAQMFARAYEQNTGNRFPHFKTAEEANEFARKRSQSGAVTSGPLARPPGYDRITQAIQRQGPTSRGQTGPTGTQATRVGPIQGMTPQVLNLLRSGALGRQGTTNVLAELATKSTTPQTLHFTTMGDRVVGLDKTTGRKVIEHRFDSPSSASNHMKIARELYPEGSPNWEQNRQDFVTEMAELDILAKEADIYSKTKDPDPTYTERLDNEIKEKLADMGAPPETFVLMKTFGKEALKHALASVDANGDLDMDEFTRRLNETNTTNWETIPVDKFKAQNPGIEVPPNTFAVSVDKSKKNAPKFHDVPKTMRIETGVDDNGNQYTRIVEGGPGDTGVPTGQKTKLQTAIAQAGARAQSMRNTMRSYDEEFLTGMGRAKSFIDSWLDWLGADWSELSKQDKARLGKHQALVSDVMRDFVQTLKFLSGAAVTVPEARRATAFLATAGGDLRSFWEIFKTDSPTVFISKINNGLRWQEAVMTRNRLFDRFGIDMTTANMDQYPLTAAGNDLIPLGVETAPGHRDMVTLKDFMGTMGRLYMSEGVSRTSPTKQQDINRIEMMSDDAIIDEMPYHVFKRIADEWRMYQGTHGDYGAVGLPEINTGSEAMDADLKRILRMD